VSDLNPDKQSISLIPPYFLGTINGEGLRKSVGSFSSRARLEGFSSLCALNSKSLSARGSSETQDFAGHYCDDPCSLPNNPFYGPSVSLSTLSSHCFFLFKKQAIYPCKTSKSRRNTIILSALGGLLLLIAATKQILPTVLTLGAEESDKEFRQYDTTPTKRKGNVEH